jgi:hypothetical protein
MIIFEVNKQDKVATGWILLLSNDNISFLRTLHHEFIIGSKDLFYYKNNFLKENSKYKYIRMY